MSNADAAFEVGRPVVFGVFIIVAVYIPIFTLQGLEGRMFEPMAFTVCTAVFGSLILALTYIPAVSTYALAGVREVPSRWFARLREWYRGECAWLQRRGIGVDVARRVGRLATHVQSLLDIASRATCCCRSATSVAS